MKCKLLLFVTLFLLFSTSTYAIAHDADVKFVQITVDAANSNSNSNSNSYEDDYFEFTLKIRNLSIYTSTNMIVSEFHNNKTSEFNILKF